MLLWKSPYLELPVIQSDKKTVARDKQRHGFFFKCSLESDSIHLLFIYVILRVLGNIRRY